MRNRWLSYLAIAGLAAGVAACGSSDKASDGGATADGGQGAATSVATGVESTAAAEEVVKGGRLKLGLEEDLDYWDGTTYYGIGWSVGFVTSNGLLDYPNTPGPDGDTLVPGVAADLPEISEDGKTYTFTIRKGLKFNNGKALTPQDVKCTYERNLNPESGFYDGALGSGYYNVIEGMEEFTKADDEGNPLPDRAKEISGIEVQGDKVSFTLTEVDPGFQNATAMRFMTIIPCGTPLGHTKLPPPATGPYMVTDYKPKKSVKIDRNPHWEANVAAGMPQADNENNVDGIDIEIGVPGDQQLLRIKNNDLDFSFGGDAPVGADVEAVANDPQFENRFFSSDDSAITYYVMKTDRPPFDNVKLRQAVNYAIDREAEAKITGGPLVRQPWPQILSAPLLGEGQPTDIYPSRPDVDKAKQLIEESGVPTPIKITLVSFTGSPDEDLAANAKQNLDAVGFDTTIKLLDRSTFYGFISEPKSDYNIAGAAWGQDFPDAITFFRPLLSCESIGGGTNYGQFCDKAYEEKINEIARMPIGDDRNEAWAALSTDMAQNAAPWATVLNRRYVSFISDKVGNYLWQPTKQFYFGLYYKKQ